MITPKPPGDERGAAALFIVLMTVAMLAAAGLVIDGGAALGDRRTLTNQAEQAARIGADALNQDSLRDGGRPTVDPARARAAADAYLRSVGAPPASIRITGGRVTVTLTGQTTTNILSLAGLTSITVTGTGTAESIDADNP
ncbi:TadE/TadG family type IV pilus assembly protein [Aeromicrobium alkaliterrae]|uniref:Putative Flp pilus-assembly TadG-like N-terminal domain-containing protein n=1 Tax=Aeromicrobium alkaliterrae TaxID=302168 RepID=A0ABN2KE55_9ACTN